MSVTMIASALPIVFLAATGLLIGWLLGKFFMKK